MRYELMLPHQIRTAIAGTCHVVLPLGVLEYHGEHLAVGMPTDLAFKFAARQAIFAFLEKTRGEGWWGSDKMAEYYAQQKGGDDPFNWIKGHPLMTAETISQYPFDHAGVGETSLMLALCPEAVDMERVSQKSWYTRDAKDANTELGSRGRDLILTNMRRALNAS